MMHKARNTVTYTHCPYRKTNIYIYVYIFITRWWTHNLCCSSKSTMMTTTTAVNCNSNLVDRTGQFPDLRKLLSPPPRVSHGTRHFQWRCNFFFFFFCHYGNTAYKINPSLSHPIIRIRTNGSARSGNFHYASPWGTLSPGNLYIYVADGRFRVRRFFP